MPAKNTTSNAKQPKLNGGGILDRKVSLRVFLFCLLVGLLFTVMFGWSVRSTLSGSNLSGRFGEAAVVISSFPSTVRLVLDKTTSEEDDEYRVPRNRSDLLGYEPVSTIRPLEVRGLMLRADTAATQQAAGWRILVGIFMVDGEPRNAAIALSPELEIANVWVLTEEGISGVRPLGMGQTFAHGFDILRDGSIIFSFDRGKTLQRVDRCGSQMWAIGDELFHHAVSLDDDEEFVWVLYIDEKRRTPYDPSEYFAKVATATGEIVRRFSAADIIEANPDIDILEIRKIDEDDPTGNSKNTSEKWAVDPFHFNDVEPLPSKFAASFVHFGAGDLLISARSLNLVFVIDPNTLKVKWWRSGAFRRQHDPDWNVSGEITIFNNRMSADYSEIVAISPETYRSRVLFDGRKNDFYSRVRGQHQITSVGNLLVTSPQQGRVFEIDSAGDMVLEILNTNIESDDVNYVVTNAMWLPTDALNLNEFSSCE